MDTVKDQTRPLTERNLSTRAAHGLKFGLSNIAARFNRKLPHIQSFPLGRPCPLVQQLCQVNVLMPTLFCRVMTGHGSDKGSHWHNYTTIYSALFGKLRQQPLRIFELGLGTNDPSLPSTMGERGVPGASLVGWRELFPQASIFGADIDRRILFESERIQTFYCDQLDADAITRLWAQPATTCGMDIIIDDGLHTFDGNLSFLRGSLQHLLPGGYYIVEDIASTTILQWTEHLQAASQDELKHHEIALLQLPNKFNLYDNNLLILRSLG